MPKPTARHSKQALRARARWEHYESAAARRERKESARGAARRTVAKVRTLQLRLWRPWMQMPEPPHSLQRDFWRSWGHREEPLHSLQVERWRLCSQMDEPPQSCRLCNVLVCVSAYLRLGDFDARIHDHQMRTEGDHCRHAPYTAA